MKTLTRYEEQEIVYSLINKLIDEVHNVLHCADKDEWREAADRTATLLAARVLRADDLALPLGKIGKWIGENDNRWMYEWAQIKPELDSIMMRERPTIVWGELFASPSWNEKNNRVVASIRLNQVVHANGTDGTSGK